MLSNILNKVNIIQEIQIILKMYRMLEKRLLIVLKYRNGGIQKDTNGMNNIEIFGIPYLKKGSGIHIKKKNRGKFTEYCGGKVTNKCI
jgi:hypothetical protein